MISKDGIEMEKVKIELISNLLALRSMSEIKAFLGQAKFYRRFIKNFSKLDGPLINLLSRDVKFDFDFDYVQALNKLKVLISMAPIIKPPY